MINFGLAILVLTIFALTPKGKDLLGSRFFGIVDTITGEYDRRLLENQIKTKNWREIRFAFSDAAVATMRANGNNGGEFKNRHLFVDSPVADTSYALSISRTNPSTVQYSPYVGSTGEGGVILSDWGASADVAMKFKVSGQAISGATYLSFSFWQTVRHSETYLLVFDRRDNRLASISYFSLYEEDFLDVDETDTISDIGPDLEGYYTVEFVLEGRSKSSSIFINGNPVLSQKTRKRGTSNSSGNFEAYRFNYGSTLLGFSGARASYKIKDFSIAILTEEPEEE